MSATAKVLDGWPTKRGHELGCCERCGRERTELHSLRSPCGRFELFVCTRDPDIGRPPPRRPFRVLRVVDCRRYLIAEGWREP